MSDKEKFKKILDELGIKYEETCDNLYIDAFHCDGAQSFGISFWDGEDYPEGSYKEFWVEPEMMVMSEKDYSAYIEGYKAAKAEFGRPQDHWEDITPPGAFTPGGDPIGRCPICKSSESIHNIGVEGPHWNFCPICGAQMVDDINIEKEGN